MVEKNYKLCFSLKLKAYREKHGYTQRYIAYKFGVTQQSVAKWEAGKSLPKICTFLKINKIIDGDEQ